MACIRLLFYADVIQLGHCMFAGKTLIACKTAVKNFTSILETVGGPQEKKRGRLLQIDLKL